MTTTKPKLSDLITKAVAESDLIHITGSVAEDRWDDGRITHACALGFAAWGALGEEGLQEYRRNAEPLYDYVAGITGVDHLLIALPDFTERKILDDLGGTFILDYEYAQKPPSLQFEQRKPVIEAVWRLNDRYGWEPAAIATWLRLEHGL